MNVQLYKNSSSNNVVDKNISDELIVENVRFKEDNSLDISAPTVILNTFQDVEEINGFNYCRIPKFDSYYYITNISFIGSLVELDLQRDVLMTWKNTILNSTQYIKRQENKKNKYIVDNQLPIHSDHTYLIRTFGENVEDVECINVILETMGRLS